MPSTWKSRLTKPSFQLTRSLKPKPGCLKLYLVLFVMSLAAASEARKERLLSLRRKRAGEDDPDTRYVTPSFFFSLEPKKFVLIRASSGGANQPVLINRNFDPETRTLRKHQTNVEMGDTLESNVKGLAEQIIAEDEAKRAQDLVTVIFSIETSTPFTLHVKDLLNIAPKRPNWDL